MTAAAIFKIIVLLLLFAILVSLSSGVFFLVHDKGRTSRLAKSLTVRIGLSVALFVLLLVGYCNGLIRPHGLAVEAPIEFPRMETSPE